MSVQAQLRNRYARESVTTASPGQLVVMLYDRLLRDLTTAEQGLADKDIPTTHQALTHAQDILTELNTTLDTSVWKEGESLKRIYEWSIDELVQANMRKDAQHVKDVHRMIEPLADAWKQILAQGHTGER